MTHRLRVVFGCAGSGKTTRLIEELMEIHRNGIPLSQIAYLTMTRSARKEARQRMHEQFKATDEDLHYFRTMHSICLELLGESGVVKLDDKIKFCQEHGVDFDSQQAEEVREDDMLFAVVDSDTVLGNLYFSAYDQLRLVHLMDIDMLTESEFLTKFWIKFCEKLRFDLRMMSLTSDHHAAYKFMKAWKARKDSENLVDYADMLYKVYKAQTPLGATVLIVDEFQDFSPLMYEVYKMWKQNMCEVIVGGDDDQTIYSFISATPKFLLAERDEALNNGGMVEILSECHRCPDSVVNFAHRIIKRNTVRQDKSMQTKKTGGKLFIYNEYDDDILLRHLPGPLRDGKRVFVLARTRATAHAVRNMFEKYRIPYTTPDGKYTPWTDNFFLVLNAVRKLIHKEELSEAEGKQLIAHLPKEYVQRGIKAEIKRGKSFLGLGESWKGLYFAQLTSFRTFGQALKLTKPQKGILASWDPSAPILQNRVVVSTIHGVKGEGADTVIVIYKIPKYVKQSLKQEDIEAERRVLYVGATRAKGDLIMIGNVQF